MSTWQSKSADAGDSNTDNRDNNLRSLETDMSNVNITSANFQFNPGATVFVPRPSAMVEAPDPIIVGQPHLAGGDFAQNRILSQSGINYSQGAYPVPYYICEHYNAPFLTNHQAYYSDMVAPDYQIQRPPFQGFPQPQHHQAHVPSQVQQHHQIPSSGGQLGREAGSGNGTVGDSVVGEQWRIISEIQVGLEVMVGQPENFDCWAEAIMDRVESGGCDDVILEQVVTTVVEMALSGGQNAFLVAKLCAYLCRESHRKGSMIRGSLLSRCRLEHENRSVTILEFPERLRNFTLFMGELYVQLLSQNGNRLQILRSPLLQLLDELMLIRQGCLSTSDIRPVVEGNIKTAVLLLKCCGWAIEEDSGPTAVQEKIDRLSATVNQFSISGDVARGLQSLSELKENGWGRAASVVKNGPESDTTSNSSGKPPGSPLYIGPDGVPLTKEELAFLDENLSRQDSDMGGDISRESMSLAQDESQEELEKFIQENTLRKLEADS